MVNSSELNATIIIHKKAVKGTDIGNWRPITIGNLLQGYMLKCWDTRLRSRSNFHPERQKAFMPVDGVFENRTNPTTCDEIGKKKISKQELNLGIPGSWRKPLTHSTFTFN